MLTLGSCSFLKLIKVFTNLLFLLCNPCLLSGPILHSVFDPHHRVYFCSTLHACKFQSFSVNFNLSMLALMQICSWEGHYVFFNIQDDVILKRVVHIPSVFLICHAATFKVLIASSIALLNLRTSCSNASIAKSLAKTRIIMICSPSGRRGS